MVPKSLASVQMTIFSSVYPTDVQNSFLIPTITGPYFEYALFMGNLITW